MRQFQMFTYCIHCSGAYEKHQHDPPKRLKGPDYIYLTFHLKMTTNMW